MHHLHKLIRELLSLSFKGNKILSISQKFHVQDFILLLLEIIHINLSYFIACEETKYKRTFIV
jgi:hypothetical protein